MLLFPSVIVIAVLVADLSFCPRFASCANTSAASSSRSAAIPAPRGPACSCWCRSCSRWCASICASIVDEVPPQDVISRDNVSVKVSAVIYFRVVDPERAIIQVSNYLMATSQLAQTTLRWVLGKHDLDEMLAERDKLNAGIQDVLDKQTEGWGIKVSNVEIKRIDLDESMVRAIARQAEAERERRAKIINAEGEQQAAQKLVEAARILAAVPQAMQLRYLATLFDIASERDSTIVFPFPIELGEFVLGHEGGGIVGHSPRRRHMRRQNRRDKLQQVLAIRFE